MVRGDKPYLRKSTYRKVQISPLNWTNAFLICALRCVDFSGKVYHPKPPHAQSLFLFPIVFGINLIHFFDGKNKIGLGRIWSFVLGFRSLVERLVPFGRGGTKRVEEFLAMESVNSLRISAPQWWPLREGRDGKCEGRNEKCEFLARESVSSSPIVRIFGKGKCEFIANFSATMVTTLPSLSLYLSHRKYLTHNIWSASFSLSLHLYFSSPPLHFFLTLTFGL